MDPHAIQADLATRFPGRCSFSSAARRVYRADLWPRFQIRKRFDLPGAEPPLAIVHAESEADVEAALTFARGHGLALVPYGAGSGVMGGTICVRPSLMLDMKRMGRLMHVDAEAGLARVEAGKIGQELETELRARGWTLGHYPSSIHCSTVGGYAATRSAGQFSSKYGKFEDMVEGLRVLTPGAGWLDVDRAADQAAGSAFVDALVGSEGTLGVVTRVDLRVHSAPEEEVYRGLSLPSVEAGWDVMRAILQAGLRPNVLRLYDPFDSVVALRHSLSPDEAAPIDPDTPHLELLLAPLEDLASGVSGEVQRRALRQILKSPGLTNRLIDRLLKRTALILGFEGRAGDPTRDMDAALALAKEAGARDLGPEPGLTWLQRRHAISFKQAPIFALGGFVDTMEVASSWTDLPRLYASARAALGRHAFVMAHFSHAYPDGCSIYFTFAALRDSAPESLALYDRLWQEGSGATLAAGGTLSHHHGVGLLKRSFLEREVENGGDLYGRLKATLDPEGLLNPGKLWSPA